MLYPQCTCPKHGHIYVSMPRDTYAHDESDLTYLCKCPLVECQFGILRNSPRAEDLKVETCEDQRL